MALAVLVDVANSVQLRLSNPSRITVNISCISCDVAATQEAPFMASLFVTRFSMFSDGERIFSAGSGFLFHPGFSLVPLCFCVLISVLFSFVLRSKLLLLKMTLPFAFKGGNTLSSRGCNAISCEPSVR